MTTVERTISVRLRALTSQFGSDMTGAARTSAKFATKHQQAMSTAGKASMAFGAALTYGLVKAADAANQLNADMAAVGTLIPGQTQRVYELRDGVQDLAVDVGKSTADVSAGLYQVVSAFGDTADTVDILRINTEGARAGMASTSDAIALTSSVTKGYGDTSAEAVEHAMDLAFTTVKLGQTDFPQLASAIGSVVPLASALNVTQEELFGTMATFTGVTGGASEVATQLESTLTALMNPSAELQGLMDKLGHSSGEAMIEAMGLEGAVKAIAAEADASGVPIMAFLRRKEAVTLALAGAGGQADVWTEKMGQTADATGALEEALAEMTEGIGRWQFDAEQAAVQQEVAMQKLGESIAPVKAAFTGFLGDTAEGFSNLSPEMQAVIAKAGMVASGVGIVGGASLIAVPKVAALNATLATTGGILGTYGAALRATGRFLAGPWGIALTGAMVGINSYRDAKARAVEISEQFQEALDAESGQLDEATRSVVAAQIEARGLADALDDASLSVDDITDAIAGVPEAQDKVNEGLDYGLLSWNRWRDAIIPTTTITSRFRSEAGDLRETVAELADGFDDAAVSTEAGRNAIELLNSGVGGWVDRVRNASGVTDEMRAKAAEAGFEIDAMTGKVQTSASAFDPLPASVADAFTTEPQEAVTP